MAPTGFPRRSIRNRSCPYEARFTSSENRLLASATLTDLVIIHLLVSPYYLAIIVQPVTRRQRVRILIAPGAVAPAPPIRTSSTVVVARAIPPPQPSGGGSPGRSSTHPPQDRAPQPRVLG